MASNSSLNQESLSRAVQGQSVANYSSIFTGFMARGIPEEQIKPRENVFTYNAWLALGRQVRKGEHGVKCVTFIVCEDKKREQVTGKKSSFRRPWTTTVFHVSQTDSMLDATPENVPFAGGE
jgi:antirestriction protein ArdC